MRTFELVVVVMVRLCEDATTDTIDGNQGQLMAAVMLMDGSDGGVL